MKEFLTSLKGWMGNGFSIFVYVTIVLLFIIGILRCVVPVSRNRKKLTAAIRNIKKGDKARHSWQEDRFLGKGNLMSHWSDYLNNLFFADGEYHNPANVEDYINEETVIEGPGSVRFAEALPGVLVSLGFLGTLLGLSLSLSEMNAVDASTITQSMDVLLSSMKYAFLTSIFGVIASITFTLINRWVVGRTQTALTDFYNAMERHAGVLSVDPMTQVAIYQQEQTAILKQLLDAFSGEKLTEIMRPVTEAAMMTGEQQQRMMEQVATLYVSKMNEAMGGQLEQLSATISETCRYQERSLRSVNDSLVEFASAAAAIHDIREDASQLLDKMNRALDRMDGTLSGLTDTAGSTSTLLTEQSNCIDGLACISDELQKMAVKLTSSADTFAENAQKLSASSAQSLKGAAEALEKSGSELGTAMTSAREQLSRDMDESLNYFEGCMTQIIKKVEKAVKTISAAVDELPEAVKAAAKGDDVPAESGKSDPFARVRAAFKKDGGDQ